MFQPGDSFDRVVLLCAIIFNRHMKFYGWVVPSAEWESRKRLWGWYPPPFPLLVPFITPIIPFFRVQLKAKKYRNFGAGVFLDLAFTLRAELCARKVPDLDPAGTAPRFVQNVWPTTGRHSRRRPSPRYLAWQ